MCDVSKGCLDWFLQRCNSARHPLFPGCLTLFTVTSYWAVKSDWSLDVRTSNTTYRALFEGGRQKERRCLWWLAAWKRQCRDSARRLWRLFVGCADCPEWLRHATWANVFMTRKLTLFILVAQYFLLCDWTRLLEEKKKVSGVGVFTTFSRRWTFFFQTKLGHLPYSQRNRTDFNWYQLLSAPFVYTTCSSFIRKTKKLRNAALVSEKESNRPTTMETVTDQERRTRLLRLEERVLNPRDILNADCLLVMWLILMFIESPV